MDFNEILQRLRLPNHSASLDALPEMPDPSRWVGESQGDKIKKLEENIIVLHTMIQTVISLLTQEQIAAYPAAYDRTVSALQMKIVSSNSPTENSQE